MSIPFLPNMGMSKSAAMRPFYEMGASKEEVDLNLAERSKRLAVLFNSDVWKFDLAPMITKLYDDTLEAVKEKHIDPDALKTLDDLVVRLGGSLQLGVGAMQRIAARRLSASEKAELKANG